MKWTRTCQECGHKQSAKEPDNSKPLTTSYTNSKCRSCGSEGLDYGSSVPETPEEIAAYKKHNREWEEQ